MHQCHWLKKVIWSARSSILKWYTWATIVMFLHLTHYKSASLCQVSHKCRQRFPFNKLRLVLYVVYFCVSFMLGSNIVVAHHGMRVRVFMCARTWVHIQGGADSGRLAGWKVALWLEKVGHLWFKYVGIMIINNLTCKHHLEKVNQILNFTLANFRHLRNDLSTEAAPM